jgi:hypothetical protein
MSGHADILSKAGEARLHVIAARGNFARVVSGVSGTAHSRRSPFRASPSHSVIMRLVATVVLLGCAFAEVRAQTGRIEGTVTDSIHLAPLPGAAVSAMQLGVAGETTLVALADDRGRFRFDALSPGQYAVSFASPFLDSLEFGGPTRRVAVGPGEAASVALATPSGTTLRRLACPGMALSRGTGALLGLVTDADSDKPLSGAQVAAMWTELTFDGVMRRVSTAEHSGGVIADSLGQYRLCGVPTDSWLLVQLRHGDRVGAAFQVIVSEETGVQLRHISMSAEGAHRVSVLDAAERGGAPLPPLRGSASLAGVVRNARGLPVANAQVRIVSTEPLTRTDGEGRFSLGGLPAGTQEIEVREIGSPVQRQPVELRSGRTVQQQLVLRRIVALDTVRTVAARRAARYDKFESNRRSSLTGAFFSQKDIERRHLQQVSDLFLSMVSFRVIGQGAGARVMNNRGRCYPNVVVDYKENQDINVVPPSLVAAIEVYPTINGAPAEFTNLCGVIRIWVKQ